MSSYRKAVSLYIITLAAVLWTAVTASADQFVRAVPVETLPQIDGRGDDPAWASAPLTRTRDVLAELDIDIRAVYTKEHICFLVQFPDKNESRVQKPWIWNSQTQMYEPGPHREDTFIFKWLLLGEPSTLSVHSDEPYVADIWFWKAERTDAVGFADDKIQCLYPNKLKNSVPLTSVEGKQMYLQRKGDRGSSAYDPLLYVDYENDTMAGFIHKTPEGSRGDIRAKGHWEAGRWTVEFYRKMITRHSDDVQFYPAKLYFFGVSRHEIAGREPDPSLTDPRYGAGDVSERLFLIFESPETNR